MDQITNLSQYSISTIPFVILSMALIGSWHCSMMCGGLVLASCKTKVDHFFYQLGRLSGYLLLATSLHFLGQILIQKQIKSLANFSAISIGVIFILIGIKHLKNDNFHLPLPNFLIKLSTSLNKKFINFPLFVGLFSFFLPCGFLYSVMLATIPLNSLLSSLLIAFFFWLGTAPALIAAPAVIQKILTPLRKKVPVVISICFITLGILSIISIFGKDHSHHGSHGNHDSHGNHSKHKRDHSKMDHSKMDHSKMNH